MFLSGCAGGYLTAPGTYTDKVKIKTVIHNYLSAINSKGWDSAKSLCVYESDAYSSTSFLEKLINDMHYQCSIVGIDYYLGNISNVSIDGNDAKAYVYVTMVTICDEITDIDSFPSTIFSLEKIGTDWKIYHWKNVD